MCVSESVKTCKLNSCKIIWVSGIWLKSPLIFWCSMFIPLFLDRFESSGKGGPGHCSISAHISNSKQTYEGFVADAVCCLMSLKTYSFNISSTSAGDGNSSIARNSVSLLDTTAPMLSKFSVIDSTFVWTINPNASLRKRIASKLWSADLCAIIPE